MNERQKQADEFKQRQQFILAYYKELDTRRNSLWELLFIRMALWEMVCVGILLLPATLISLHTLLYSTPLVIVWLLLIFVFELYKNQKRPPLSHSS